MLCYIFYLLSPAYLKVKMFEIFSLRNSFLSADVVLEDQFDVELIVQCIRSSESPQTHNQALLLLATAAKFFPVSISFFSALILIQCTVTVVARLYSSSKIIADEFGLYVSNELH